MDSWESNRVAEVIERKLREIIIKCIEEYDGECDFERKVRQSVSERMYGFVRSSSSFDLNVLREYELKNSSCDVSSGNDCVRGKIKLEYHEKQDRYKYGEPGYRGNEDGEICQYPDYADKY